MSTQASQAAPSPEIAVSHFKKQAVVTLTRLRAQWRNLRTEDERRAFLRGAVVALWMIEELTPDWERWTHLPDESDLTEKSNIGDHLAATRKLMGLIP